MSLWREDNGNMENNGDDILTGRQNEASHILAGNLAMQFAFVLPGSFTAIKSRISL